MGLSVPADAVCASPGPRLWGTEMASNMVCVLVGKLEEETSKS